MTDVMEWLCGPEIKKLQDKNTELLAVIEKIASLDLGPGPALARSALDTMRVLDKP